MTFLPLKSLKDTVLPCWSIAVIWGALSPIFSVAILDFRITAFEVLWVTILKMRLHKPACYLSSRPPPVGGYVCLQGGYFQTHAIRTPISDRIPSTPSCRLYTH